MMDGWKSGSILEVVGGVGFVGPPGDKLIPIESFFRNAFGALLGEFLGPKGGQKSTFLRFFDVFFRGRFFGPTWGHFGTLRRGPDPQFVL